MLAVGGILINGDSNSCNTILVAKYPSNVCPRYITKLALNLQDSRAFFKPQGSPFISDMADAAEMAEITKDFEFVPAAAATGSERIWQSFSQVQAALQEANRAVESSKCDHGLVQVSLIKIQSALDALGQQLPKKDYRRHKRATSVAYEALAFQ